MAPIGVGALILLCTGCNVLGVPSYRADAVGGLPEQVCHSPENTGFTADGEACPPGVLPPLPGWLHRWHAKQDIPAPAAYPRFHPLPTRPMFEPDPLSAAEFGNGLYGVAAPVTEYGLPASGVPSAGRPSMTSSSAGSATMQAAPAGAELLPPLTQTSIQRTTAGQLGYGHFPSAEDQALENYPNESQSLSLGRSQFRR